MRLERPQWPGGKKCAAMITINLNAELFWLQLDKTCVNMPKTLSLGQYGMNRGLDRILNILDDKGIKATCFTPGWVAEHYPDKILEIRDRGHEIGAMGYRRPSKKALRPSGSSAA